jgi:hypothetical protein
MKRIGLFSIIFILFCGCDNSKWETIIGQGINDEPQSIEKVIYFEDENNGVVGGCTLISDSNAQNAVKLSEIPTLYLTADGGKKWTEVHFDSTIRQSLLNAYLHLDTLICQTDSLALFSTNKGVTFQCYKDSIQYNAIVEKYLKNNKSEIKDHNFQYQGIKYSIKELFQNDLATVIVCSLPQSLTNYYFVSFDKGKDWNFLQETFGDNRQRFLLKDKYLYCYHFPLGLQRLKLK